LRLGRGADELQTSARKLDVERLPSFYGRG
jgi:hypothetical protein